MGAAARLFAFLTLVSTALGGLPYVGIAIPGIDFGCDIDGNCPLDTIALPLPWWGGGNGPGQMKHFVEDDGMNVFRLPATWQFLTNNQLSGDLDAKNFAGYHDLMKACLATGAYCMIDVHNFARWDGGIIGQGGPDDDVFVDLWLSLANRYLDEERVIFGLMNEPHDLDVDVWAQTCQKVVTAVRGAGAASQMILLPGTNFTNALTFVSTGSAEALARITNPDGGQDGLVMDLHKYLDENNSGSFAECVTDNVDAFETVGQWLRQNKRMGMISETGASSDPSCMVDFCEQNKYISQNSDVFLGFVGWGAGSFDTSYLLSLTPTETDGKWEDNELCTKCIVDQFGKAEAGVKPPPSGPDESESSATARSTTTTTSAAATSTASAALSSGSAAATEDAAQPSHTSGASAWGRVPAVDVVLGVAALHGLGYI